MIEKRAIVRAQDGLHARPASEFAQAASRLSVAVTIRTETSGPQQADSVLGLMMLGAACGDEVILSADGEGADEALDSLAGLLESSS